MVLALSYFMFSSIYHLIYIINNEYAWYYTCSTWFLDIRISTCLTLNLVIHFTHLAGPKCNLNAMYYKHVLSIETQ